MKEKLPIVEEKYQKLCNLNYMQSKKARDEIKEIIDELSKDKELVLEKISNHDLSVRFKGRQIVKICPLKNGWSASLKGASIRKDTKESVLSAVKVLKLEPHKIIKEINEAEIKKLEERISKLSKSSIGISIKEFHKTKELKNWIKEKGYKLEGDTLLVK